VDASDVAVDLENGPIPGTGGTIAMGCDTSSLTLLNISAAGANLRYRCIATHTAGACGHAASLPADLLMCVADSDDGSGSGTCDGGVGVEDLLYQLNLYDLGSLVADVDDGTGSGAPDGGVGIEDLLYYLQRYDAGC
jgi:hypothetical protein